MSDAPSLEKLAERVDALTRSVERLESRLAELEAPPADPETQAPAQSGVQRLRTRARHWTTPRLGVHRQHKPRPLMIPARYLRAKPPRRAPSISIVTPSYNQAEFLPRTIESVLSQGYPELEYVVQDGGSTDGSYEVLERYAKLLTGWRSESDRGQAAAVNRGFLDMSGEIMAWLNSDDLLLPGALATVGRYFSRHPDVDVVYGNRVLIDEWDAHVGSWVLPPHDDDVLALKDFVPQETMFWRRRLWQRAGGHLDERYRLALDWELLLRFRAAGAKMVRLPRFLGAFRIHAEQKNETITSIGMEEAERLREQVQGRPVGPSDLDRSLAPYLRGHLLRHTARGALWRLPLPRVQALPEMKLARPPVPLRAAAEAARAPLG
jgi:glycosyl transferase family 2